MPYITPQNPGILGGTVLCNLISGGYDLNGKMTGGWLRSVAWASAITLDSTSVMALVLRLSRTSVAWLSGGLAAEPTLQPERGLYITTRAAGTGPGCY